jgi:signal transduction histidine kinase
MDVNPTGGRPRWKTLAGAVALAAVYFATARAGLAVATVGRSVTLLWAPSGLAVAALVVLGRRLWPGVAVAAFAVNVLTPGVSPLAAAMMAVGNTSEALLAAWLLQRSHFDPFLRRMPDVGRLLVLGGVLSTGAAAVAGTLALRLGGVIAAAEVPLSLRIWWLGDLMGVLVVAPLLWSARGLRELPRPRTWRVIEGAVLALALLSFTAAIFRQAPGDVGHGYLRSYLVFPGLLWAALRFEVPGAALANFAVAAVASWATLNHTGPFALGSLNESLLTLQIFMAIAVLTSLVLAAAASERADAIRAREDFISIASHELRTPLTPLTLQIDRLQRRLSSGQNSPDALNAIHLSLQRQADRLIGLVDILLDITRLRTGRMPLDCEPVDLAAVARDTVDGMTDELQRAGCPVRVDAPAPVPGTWDRTRLQQALTNLLTNATRYAAGAPVTVTVSAMGQQARLVVTDAGPGIAFDDQSRLFRRFARLPVNGLRAGGLGLGLYITREIIEAHGGTIRLDSRPGQGAAFTCLLPRDA